MTENTPLISTVIATYNRPLLVTRAVRSALNQTLQNIEVIVIIDGPNDDNAVALGAIADRRLKVHTLPSRQRLAAARNAGVALARGKWIALLDDDDEWLPHKLEKQLATAEQSPYQYPIVASQLIARNEWGDRIWPRRTPEPDENLSEYLLCQRSLFAGDGLVLPSVIFTSKELLTTMPLRRVCKSGVGGDIDWLLRALRAEGVGLEFVSPPEPLAIWNMQEKRDRLSTTGSWRDSLSWISTNEELATPRARASYILTWVSKEARKANDLKAMGTLLHNAFRIGRPDWRSLLAFLIIWFVPQSFRTRATRVHKPVGSRSMR